MSRASRVPRRRRPDSGEALVEMALVLPILLVLSLGMLDFGRAFHTKNIVDAAAREACRVAVVTAPDVALAKARADVVLAAAGVTGSTDVVGPGPDRMVTVTVTTRFAFVTPGLYALFGSLADPTGINMIGKATMRQEGSG
ncbi:MAG TPA: TadE/TadG family type IV pilus assembly protein [Candidatus Binatia bacterium]|nr:TadE/TadG family type IV pilus assembly protein [Candidatus Binatia bacterium]